MSSLVLPNFLIIGAAKSGTTSLYQALNQHPKVFMPYNKEPSFFNNDDNYARGTAWYSETYFKNAAHSPLRGEATPGYLFWSEKVAPRIRDTYRQDAPRLIVIMRDPVDRAYSAYWHLRQYGGESLSFRDALSAEPERLARQGDALQASGFIKFAYFQGGCYASQLGPFLSRFPRESFLFLFFQDLRSNPAETFHRICEFLGVPPPEAQQFGRHNRARKMRSESVYRWIRRRSPVKEALKPLMPQSMRFRIKLGLQNLNMKAAPYPPMDADIAADLRLRYTEEIRALEKIAGRDLSAWLSEQVNA